MELIKIKERLKDKLDKTRYEHTIGVADTAACLSMSYGYDMNKAYLTGLLHDCAKCVDDEKKVKECIERNIEISDIEMNNKSLLHAKLGAAYASEKYEVNDIEVLDAIRCHTTGKPDMNMLEQIIFVADYIEPNRNKAENLPMVRSLAFDDLDLCTFVILRDTLSYLETKDMAIDITTKETYNFYKKIIERNPLYEGYIKDNL